MSEEFQQEVLSRLTGIEGAIARLAFPSPAPAPAPAAWGGTASAPAAKQAKLNNIQTTPFKVKKVWDDFIGAKKTAKWNVEFTDQAGATKKIGTFDSALGLRCKAAQANGEPLTVTWGMNTNGYPEIVSIS